MPACGALLDEVPGIPVAERLPCPACGSLTRMVGARISVEARSSLSVKLDVARGLNEIRLAVLGIVVAIGLTVGFGVQSSWWVRLLAGVGSFGLTLGLLAWPRSRHLLMTLTHRVTDH
jgi:hypothetical protein